jgi:hypothetical protein
MISKKIKSVSSAEGALHILAASLVIFLCVSLGKPNAAVNLQGKQNIVKLPYDDALVYVLDDKGNAEYRIYDLNAVRALKPYSPEMEFVNDEYYMGKGEKKDIALSVLSTAENNVLNVKKSTETALVYLEIKSEGATSFTISDKNTTRTFTLTDEVYTIKIHTDCTVTFDGAASVSYKEVVRDYAPLIPAAYANDKEPLHFNLWMTTSFNFE